ncbi:hypothetical protein HGRIS_007398 [Hohenbuehelia grisea]|uniref:CS domain-containing protein n=1 Tax=Hohenbuehelia grisea TaxID=104357 RepID=A0ABR3J4V2_9AGAR
MASHPEILWAQRSSATEEAKNIVYLTINLPDINESTLEYDLQPTKLTFKTKAGSAATEIKDYAFSIDLFAEVDPEHSAKRLNTRDLSLVLRKKEAKAEFWPRLTANKLKTPFIKTDFSKWVDEDEQDGEEKIDEDDMMGGMGGMPGMGGMGGMPGMGAMGGMGGMPGMGGMGGDMGGMDFEKMMAAMGGGAGAGAGAADEPEEDDSDDDGPPPLEDAEPSKP